MSPKDIFTIYSALLIYSTICRVDSSPVSQAKSKDVVTVTVNNRPLASPISRSTTKKPKRSPKFKSVRESEAEGENDAEVITNEAEGDAGNADSAGADPPRKNNGLPRFPSFNKPHEEFLADLEKIFAHINSGLEKVVESFHELVHDPGVSHDKLFITSFNPNLFKDMVAKDDEQQAARRRFLEEQKAQEKAARAAARAAASALRSTTAKSSIL